MLEIITAIATAVAAGAAVWAAIETKRSAKAAEAAAQAASESTVAGLLNSMLTRYASAEMKNAIDVVTGYIRPIPQGQVKFQYETFVKSPDKDPGTAATIDNSRRLIAHYFQNVKSLVDINVLKPAHCKLLINKEQAELYLKIMPLEKVTHELFSNEQFHLASFEWVAGLHGLQIPAI